jgi:branched-chain amino acid transport system permease protein
MAANEKLTSVATSPDLGKSRWRVETRTRLSTAFGLVAIAAMLLLALTPFFASRGVVQDLFFILTMLVPG